MTGTTGRRMGVGNKIKLVATTFTLPIAVLVFLVVSNINEFITFGQKELLGNAYQRPLEAALQGIQEHQAVVRGCEGVQCASELSAARKLVDGAFESLGKHAHVANQLQFTAEGLGSRNRGHLTLEAVQGAWSKLVIQVEAKAANLDPLYEQLVADIRGMITHAGDTSNLILDPDLDSYYLMDVTLLALPQTQERLAKVGIWGKEILTRESLSAADRTQFAVHAAMLEEADLARIKASIATALKEDAHFYGVQPTLAPNLAQAFAAYEQLTARLIASMRAIAEGGSVSGGEFLATSMDARRASFELWDKAVVELDGLVRSRLSAYSTRRTLSLALSALALLIASAVAWALTRTITLPLNSLAGTLAPGATLLSQSVKQLAKITDASASNSEAGILCEELEAHANDMRQTVTDLVSLVHGGPVGATPPKSATGVVGHGSAAA